MMVQPHISGQAVRGGRRAPGVLRALSVLGRQELSSRFASIWIWGVASGVCLIAAVYGQGFQRAFQTETVLVSADPLAVINAIVLSVVALLLGLRLAASLAWEREHRTLEVLLVSPTNHAAVLLAKLGAEVVTLLALVATYWAYLLLAQPMGQGVLGVSDTAGLWATTAFVLPLIAFGLTVAAFMSSVRGAVVGFLILAFVLCATEAATQVLRIQAPQDMSLTLLYIRSGLESLHVALRHLSPFSYLSDLLLSASGVTVLTASRAISALGVTGLMFAMALFVSTRKGAQ